jgi:GNAT superfamily N-acetyltransferase
VSIPGFSAAGLAIDPIAPDDIPAFMEMLGEMAEFLHGSHNFVTTPEELNSVLFSTPPKMEAIIGRIEGQAAGFVTFFENYKVFSGRRCMRIDYLYVRPAFRTRPLAIAMMVYLLRVARARGYRYLEGEVLDWNLPARKMYEAFNAQEVPSRNLSLDLTTVDWSLFGRQAPATESG